MLYGSECWAPIQSSLARLQRNDRAMIRWICKVKPDMIQHIKSDVLLEKMDVPKLDDLLRANRLRWFGHVEKSDSWIIKYRDITVNSKRKAGRPKKTWKETITNDRKIWKLTKIDPKDHDAWRLSLQTAKKRRRLYRIVSDVEKGYTNVQKDTQLNYNSNTN